MTLSAEQIEAVIEFAERGYARELGAIDPKNHYTAEETAAMETRFNNATAGISALRAGLLVSPPSEEQSVEQVALRQIAEIVLAVDEAYRTRDVSDIPMGWFIAKIKAVCADAGISPQKQSEDDEFSPGECRGGSECPAVRHFHGCFEDEGNCDDPSDHDPAPALDSEQREKLIAEAEAWLNSPTATFTGGRGAVRNLVAAMAAVPEVDDRLDRLYEWFKYMEARAGRYLRSVPLPGYWDATRAFSHCAHNVRRIRDGEPPLDPPAPKEWLTGEHPSSEGPDGGAS